MHDIDVIDAPYSDVDTLQQKVKERPEGGREKDHKVEKDTYDGEEEFAEPWETG